MKILRILRLYWNSLKGYFRVKGHKYTKHAFTLKYMSDFPNEPEDKILYALGKPGNEFFVGMKCPCGCKDFIELVLNGHSPSWTLSVSRDGKPSLYPSVFRSVRCRSHFFLTKGKVKWCKSYIL